MKHHTLSLSALFVTALLAVGCVDYKDTDGPGGSHERSSTELPRPAASSGDHSASIAVQQTESKQIPYTVINREEFLDHKVSYDIMVDVVDGRLPTEDALAAISNSLRSKEQKYERMFVCFYLPEMKVDAGAFATAHHKPTPEPATILWHWLPPKYKKLAQLEDEGLVDTDQGFPDELLGTWETDSGNRMTIEKNKFTVILSRATASQTVARVEPNGDGYRVVVVEHGKEYPQTWEVAEDQFSIISPRNVAALLGSPYKRVP